jgi:hypothetical protein
LARQALARLAGRCYRYPLCVLNPDGDPLVGRLTAAPEGMWLDPMGGVVKWRPQANQEGEHEVEIEVADDRGGVATQRYTVRVVVDQPGQPPQINQPPQITSPPPFQAKVGIDYQYPVTATDPDAEPLRFELREGPADMTIEPTAGVLQWTPDATDVGSHQVIVAAVDPVGAASVQTYALSVLQANQAPQITSRPVEEVTAGLPYRYDVHADDPDGDPLTYALAALPPT